MDTQQLIIPPRPSVLLELQQQMQQEEVDVQSIARLIKQDAALYAILLSAANSPWNGLSQQIDSVEKAIVILGLKRVINLLQSVMMRSSFNDSPTLESFWNAAGEVAAISENLAQVYHMVNTEHAYTAGMLHNIGIPVMMMNFAGYSHFMQQMAHGSANELSRMEQQEFNTDHFLQGALMAKDWSMAPEVTLAIRYQPMAHDILQGKKQLPSKVIKLLAILVMAKNISHEYHHYWSVKENKCQQNTLDCALEYLEICRTEFSELKEDKINEMIKKEVA